MNQEQSWKTYGMNISYKVMALAFHVKSWLKHSLHGHGLSIPYMVMAMSILVVITCPISSPVSPSHLNHLQKCFHMGATVLGPIVHQQ